MNNRVTRNSVDTYAIVAAILPVIWAGGVLALGPRGDIGAAIFKAMPILGGGALLLLHGLVAGVFCWIKSAEVERRRSAAFYALVAQVVCYPSIVLLMKYAP